MSKRRDNIRNAKKTIRNTRKTRELTFRLYILFEDGNWFHPELIGATIDRVTQDAKLEDFGTGNAYNMPDYLLDVIEGHEDTAMVVAWDWDDDRPHPRFLVQPFEICPLIEALKANPDGDSWEIAVEVNKKLRGETC